MIGDTAADERWLIDRLVALRIFADEDGKMNKSIVDLAAGTLRDESDDGVGVLVVSQFTLAADLSPGRSKGNRPSFTRAAAPDLGRAAVDHVVAGLRTALPETVRVATGRFGAHMAVSLVNDGPVTLWLDSERSVPVASSPSPLAGRAT